MILPETYDFLERRELSKATALLNDNERNELLLKKSRNILKLLKKYNSGNRAHTMSWLINEAHYIGRIRGLKNDHIINQISRLNFEMDQFQGVTVYLNDPIGLKIAIKSIETIITLIIDEITSGSQ